MPSDRKTRARWMWVGGALSAAAIIGAAACAEDASDDSGATGDASVIFEASTSDRAAPRPRPDGEAEPDAGAEAGVDAGQEDAQSNVPSCVDGTFAYDDDFRDGLNPDYWRIEYFPDTDAGVAVFRYDDTQGDVFFEKIGQNDGSRKAIAAVLDLDEAGGPVFGDFSVEVDFRDAVVGVTGIDQIELHTRYSDDSIFYLVYSQENGPAFHVWDGSYRGNFTTPSSSGRLKIRRVGTTLSAYAVLRDDAGVPVETLVYEKTQSAALQLEQVDFVAQLFNTNNDISVRFDDFHIDGQCAPADAGVSRSRARSDRK